VPTQDEVNIAISHAPRVLDTKIELLDFKYNVIDEISGVTVDAPTITNNASSDVRRTCSLSIYPKSKEFDIGKGNAIWLDKYIRIKIGMRDIRTDNFVWSNIGTYVIDAPNHSYSANTNVISLNGLDLMCKLTGARGGKLTEAYVIPANTNIRTAIIGVLRSSFAFGSTFSHFIVSECLYPTTPNEIRVEAGGCAYDLLKNLVDIYPTYQIYFDVDGIFHYEQVPTGANEMPQLNSEETAKLLITYEKQTSFSDVYNQIKVIGKTHDIGSYYNVATTSGSTYILSIAGISSLYDGLKIGFTTATILSNPSLNLNSLGAHPIHDINGAYVTLSGDSTTYHVVKYQSSSSSWYYMGELTPTYTASETNPDSPFYIGGTMGVVPDVRSGSDYDNIFTSDSAKVRAKWDLFHLLTP